MCNSAHMLEMWRALSQWQSVSTEGFLKPQINGGGGEESDAEARKYLEALSPVLHMGRGNLRAVLVTPSPTFLPCSPGSPTLLHPGLYYTVRQKWIILWLQGWLLGKAPNAATLGRSASCAAQLPRPKLFSTFQTLAGKRCTVRLTSVSVAKCLSCTTQPVWL